MTLRNYSENPTATESAPWVPPELLGHHRQWVDEYRIVLRHLFGPDHAEREVATFYSGGDPGPGPEFRRRLRQEIKTIKRTSRPLRDILLREKPWLDPSAYDPTAAQAINPRGHYVYFLWGGPGELLYVGKSSNLLARLGAHMSAPDRRDLIGRITFSRCHSAESMSELESTLIALHRPPLNVAGNPDAA